MAFGAVDGGEGVEDVEAAVELFAGFGEEAVEEFEVEADHPAGGAADVAGDEVEDGANADDDAVGEVGGKAGGELLLLGGAEGHPNDVRRVGGKPGGDGGVVKLLCRTEGERDEGHGGDGRILRGEFMLEVGKDALAAAEECHAIALPGITILHEVVEKLRAAIRLTPNAIETAQVERHPRAVTHGEQRAVHNAAVLRIPMHHGEYVPIRHADIPRLM